MKLIIAEKPSLARNIVQGLESMGQSKLSKRDGFFEGNEYIVTWAFGHLFSLCDIETYSPKTDGTKFWSMDNIPCFPKEFRFELRNEKGNVDAGVKKQFDIIKALCNRDTVDTIINAGDADREGEIIVRLCISNALETTDGKNLCRLWLPDQTPQTVAEAVSSLPMSSEYDNLANEGFARTYIDWLYGVNLTRFATLKTGTLLRVGRVIVPIVKAIYDRDMAIRNFKSDTYLALSSKEETNGEIVELNSKIKFEKDPTLPNAAAEIDMMSRAERRAEYYNQNGAVVTKVKRKKDKIAPGKLYSLTKLQNELGKKYKMPMERSLEVLQKLYEAGYVTYPRTNSEYLATAEKGKIKQILQGVAKLGYPVTFKDGKTVFDDSKIESHSALTPTYKIPSKDALSPDEKTVYSTIMRRFVAVFCSEDCIADKTEIVIDVAGGGKTEDDLGETFTLKGTVIVQKGWTKFDDYSSKDKILPNLSEGDIVNINFLPLSKETTPPKHYTIETLNNYLKNPFKDDKAKAAQIVSDSDEYDDEDEYKAIFEGLELGTEATRTGIIDNARKSNYIDLKKDVYTILPDGEFLIEALTRMGIIMDKYKTAELGKALKKVYHSDISVADSVRICEEEIRSVFEINKPSAPEDDRDDGCVGDEIGICPFCRKGTVKRTKFGYGCSEWKSGCKFSLRGVICDRVISKANVAMLITKGRTSKIKGFISKKTGKEFDATLVLMTDGSTQFDFK